MSRRLYHFTSTRFAFDDITNRRLKIAQFHDLNDPFELRCVELLTNEQVLAFDLFRADMELRYGIVCFSRRWDTILQWSHYADRHRGVCLGFDVINSETKCGEVNYGAKKLRFPSKLDVNFMWKMLRTKYLGWRYEEEWRVFVELKDSEWNEFAGRLLYFVDFSGELVLRDVILDAENATPTEQVRDACREYSEPVRLSRVRLSPERFQLQREDLK
jgi:hypothetical protein